VALLTLLTKMRAELGLVVSVGALQSQVAGESVGRGREVRGGTGGKIWGDAACRTCRRGWKGEARKANLEDAARRARHGFFERLAEQGVVDVVATAHTMDDQAETVLAHILRGTGIAGLAGIHPVAGCVVRPLLSFRREELREFLRAQKTTLARRRNKP